MDIKIYISDLGRENFTESQVGRDFWVHWPNPCTSRGHLEQGA